MVKQLKKNNQGSITMKNTEINTALTKSEQSERHHPTRVISQEQLLLTNNAQFIERSKMNDTQPAKFDEKLH